MSDQSKLSEALREIRDRLKAHPMYAQLSVEEEISIGGDTAEYSYLVRVADEALSAQEAQPAEQAAQPVAPAVLTEAQRASLSLMVANASDVPHGPAWELIAPDGDILELSLSQVRVLAAAPAQPVAVEPVAWGFPNTAITGSNRWMLLRERVPADDQYGGAMWVPLYAAPQAGEVERAVAEERELAVRVLADVLETSGANKLHQNREEDARTLLRLARETPNDRSNGRR